MMDPHTHKTELAVEAERWFARLQSPDCSAEERAAFERWQKAGADRASAYAEVARVWSRADELAADPAIAAARREALIPAHEPAKVTMGERLTIFLRPLTARLSPAPALAGLLAVFVVGGLIVYQFLLQPTSYQTALGEQKIIELEDGSIVTLNTETLLLVKFDDERRFVILEEGQAHFDVAHDPDHPFVVRAGDSWVTALGTAFDVRNIDNEVSVTLVEGRVEVVNESRREQFSEGAEVLAPGQKLTVTEDQGVKRIAAIDLEAATSWTTGNLIFRAEPLGEMVAEVNRYSETKIIFGDPALRDIPVSGVFHVGDTQSVIIALEKSFPIRVLERASGYRLMSANPAPSDS